MNTQSSNVVFYITLSKWKVWAFTVFCWSFACVPLFIISLPMFSTFLFAEDEISRGQLFTSEIIPVVATFSLMFLIPAAIPFLFLTKLNKPIVTITRNGFSGVVNSSQQSYEWTSKTIIYSDRLANIDVNQSRVNALWNGLRAEVIIYHFFVKQKRQDIWDAINKLSPYPVRTTSLWLATKH